MMPDQYELALQMDKIQPYDDEENPVSLKVRNTASMTPLMIACKHKSIKAAKQILRNDP